MFQECLHISKIYKNKVKINDKQAIEAVLSEYKSKIKTEPECTPELISKLHEIAETNRNSNTIDDTIPDSPIVLSGTNVMQGIGQMLVLAVGEKRYYERQGFDKDIRPEEESALQVKLDKFSEQLKIIATVAAVLITVIKWGRITVEMLLLKDYPYKASDSWKNSIRGLYLNDDDSFNW